MSRAGLAVALGALLAATAAPAQAPRAEPPQAQPPRAAREAPEVSGDFAFLGLVTQNRVPGDETSGLVVKYVYPRSAAEEMGFRIGDEIRSVNDFLIQGRQSFVEELRRSNVGAKLRIRVRRDGADTPLSGRIGSYAKTMRAYQEHLRERLGGKPLPELTAAVWWDPETGKWSEEARGWERLEGKISLVFSFDDCSVCREQRLRKFALLKQAMSTAKLTRPLAFVGVYYDERPGKEGKDSNRSAAEDLLRAIPPGFPVAVAYYPEGQPSVEEREQQALMHNHGLAILDPELRVTYLQTFDVPGKDFAEAYRKAIESISAEAQAAPEGPPEAKPTGEEAGEPPPPSEKAAAERPDREGAGDGPSRP